MTSSRSLLRRTICLDCIWGNDHKSLLYTAHEAVHSAARRNDIEAMSKCHHPTATSDKNQKDKLSEITHEDFLFLRLICDSPDPVRIKFPPMKLACNRVDSVLVKVVAHRHGEKPSTVDDNNGADPDSSIKSTDRHRGAPRWSSSSKSPSDLFQQIIQRRHDKTVRLRKCDNAKKTQRRRSVVPCS